MALITCTCSTDVYTLGSSEFAGKIRWMREGYGSGKSRTRFWVLAGGWRCSVRGEVVIEWVLSMYKNSPSVMESIGGMEAFLLTLSWCLYIVGDELYDKERILLANLSCMIGSRKHSNSTACWNGHSMYWPWIYVSWWLSSTNCVRRSSSSYTQ